MGNKSFALEYKQQAKHFLEKAWEYLEAGELHHACEKGWGAASHMAKAFAEAYDLEYEQHGQFRNVLRKAEALAGNPMVGYWRSRANELHGDFYLRESLLDPESIGESLRDMSSLCDAMEPLLDLEPSA